MSNPVLDTCYSFVFCKWQYEQYYQCIMPHPLIHTMMFSSTLWILWNLIVYIDGSDKLFKEKSTQVC
jgi:hypothetical protein